MEKTIALAVIATIVAFAASYSLSVLKGRTNHGGRRQTRSLGNIAGVPGYIRPDTPATRLAKSG